MSNEEEKLNTVQIESINTKFLNQYSASPEELLAEAMEHFGLLEENTIINSISAKDHLKRLNEKKKHYHGVLTRKASFITKLGSMLLQKNVINTVQLREALNYQKHTPYKIGEVLVRLGFVREDEIAEIIDEQKKIRDILEKMHNVDFIDVGIVYREPLFEKTIKRDTDAPYSIIERIETNDISDAILDALTHFFENEKKNNVHWKSNIVGVNVSLDFENDLSQVNSEEEDIQE
ncbi:MAG: hypothetical protein AB1782_15085 [Cyanobacteriota bacterium]